MKPLIFISCGQVTTQELQLGKLLFDIITEDGRYEPYFAETQSTLEGVTANILGKLLVAEAFVGVLHPRGAVHIAPTPNDRERIITRASVWVEQEVAILAGLAELRRSSIKIQLYAKRGVVREGLRTFVMANPYEFDAEEEVARHFRATLPSWNLQFGPRALAAAEEQLLGRCADTGEMEISRTGNSGSFVRVPGWRFVDKTDRAVAAKFVEAVEILREHGLVRETGPDAFELTAAGFERARSIPRDPDWMLIEPVIQFWWPLRADETAKLRVFLRNAGSLVPSEIIVTIRFPRKYLGHEAGDLESGASDCKERVLRLSHDDCATIRPEGFDRTILNQRGLLEVRFSIERPRRAVMNEEVEISIEVDGAPPYRSRFALEQLLDQEFGNYYSLSRSEKKELSRLIRL